MPNQNCPAWCGHKQTGKEKVWQKGWCQELSVLKCWKSPQAFWKLNEAQRMCVCSNWIRLKQSLLLKFYKDFQYQARPRAQLCKPYTRSSSTRLRFRFGESPSKVKCVSFRETLQRFDDRVSRCKILNRTGWLDARSPHQTQPRLYLDMWSLQTMKLLVF